MAQLRFANGNNVYDFGTLQKGDSAIHQFEFTNGGQQDIRITNVRCDNPHLKFIWPDKDVKPGKKEVITAKYLPMAGDETGSFKNDIQVAATGSPDKVVVLHIKGAVIPTQVDQLPKSFDTSTSIKIPLSRRDRKPVKN